MTSRHAIFSSGRLRRLLGWTHLWVGLVLLLPFILLGVTGSILVYGEAIDHALGTQPRATTEGRMQSLDAILAVGLAAGTKDRADLVADRIALPRGPGDQAIIRLSGPTRDQVRDQSRGASRPVMIDQVMIDPVSLAVLRSGAPQQGWFRFAHNLHGNLLVAGRAGRATIGWIGVAMVAMALSGLYLWWPRNGKWRQAITVKRGARGLRLHRDLHNVAGFWSLPILLLILISGVYLCFPQTIGDGLRAVLPGSDLRNAGAAIRVTPPTEGTRISLDEAAALALDVAPGRQVAMIYLPTRPDQPLRLTLTEPGKRLEVPNISVLMDPWTGRIIKLQDPKDFTLGETILAWMRPLHYGLGAGLVYQALTFVSGLVIPLFAVTGLCMWWIKRRNRQHTQSDNIATKSGARRKAGDTAAQPPAPASLPSQAMKESTAEAD